MDPKAIIQETAHRPWPLQQTPWLLQMSWCDLAFFHWPVPPETLRPLIPSHLTIDTFDEEAWIGVVPFRMENVRVRWAPPIPTSTSFEELNLRTYVRNGDYSGVWFFSFDAASALAVAGARLVQNLPYFRARMTARHTGDRILYDSRRVHRGASEAELRASYQPTGPVFTSKPGTLEHWLTERYCLFSVNRSGKPFRLDIHHHPWPLQAGKAEIEHNTIGEPLGIRLSNAPPLIHFAKSLDVLAWHRVPAE